MLQTRANYRNQVFVRIGDATLEWIESTRGEEPRSSYIRRMLEKAARRDVSQEVQDGDVHSLA
jgi:hypothetical protein